MTIKNIMRVGVVAGALAGLAAAAVHAGDAPAVAQGTATLNFVKGYQGVGLTVSAGQNYTVSHDCTSIKQAARFSLPGAGSKTSSVSAGAPIYIFAQTNYMYTAPGTPGLITVRQYDCTSAAWFTPEAGHTYNAKQSSSFEQDGCPLTIVDTTTGTDVAEVESDPHPAMCSLQPPPAKPD